MFQTTNQLLLYCIMYYPLLLLSIIIHYFPLLTIIIYYYQYVGKTHDKPPMTGNGYTTNQTGMMYIRDISEFISGDYGTMGRSPFER